MGNIDFLKLYKSINNFDKFPTKRPANYTHGAIEQIENKKNRKRTSYIQGHCLSRR